MRIAVLSVLSLLLGALLAGCPGPNPLPMDGGVRTDARVDAPVTDARIDAPLIDAPLSDVPGADVPGADVPGSLCGNGSIDATEDCDGTALGGVTCIDQGFDTGTLGCAADCTFDVSACRDFSCGDGMAEGTEDCDGADLLGSTCADQGFAAGTLACSSTCAYDTSGCRNVMCGDGMIEGTEQCEGANLNGATCVSRGYTAGTLSCAACAYVETACTRCGDGTRAGTEICDGSDVGTRTCADEGFAMGTLRCAASCAAYDTSGCAAGTAPTAGQIVITEIMPDTDAISDMTGEWFEVTNTSAGSLDLRDCVFSDNQATPATFTVTTSVVIPAGGYATFARSAAPGFTPTYVYPSTWALANSNDEVRLTCGGTLIDTVLYSTSAVWGFAQGRSTSLSPLSTNATANDTATNWCRGTGVYVTVGAVSDLGTPGMANPSCAVAPVENCTNGADDDGDTLIDCLDVADCASAPSCMPAASTSLLISEYVEGSSNNKALELRNYGTAAIDLAANMCSVLLYSNGATTVSRTIALTGSVAAGDVHVLCNTSAGMALSPLCDQLATLDFNGDDAIALRCGSSVLDVFGQIGVDPGTGWGTPVITLDRTLRRTCAVTAGDTNGSDAFDPTMGWLTLPTDTFDGVGLPACAP